MFDSLLPSDLRTTPLANVTTRKYADVDEQTRAYARRFLRREYPLTDHGVSLAIDDFGLRASRSANLDEALQACDQFWIGVLLATAVEVYGLRFIANAGDGVEWQAESLRQAARVLRSRRRPHGIRVEASELAGTAIFLERLARDLDWIVEQHPVGRPAEPPARLYERLEGPFSKTSKAARARFTVGLIHDFAGLEVSAVSILESEKKADQRARKTESRRAADIVAKGTKSLQKPEIVP